MSNNNKIEIKNKRAWHDYNIIETYIAGIQLTGTEIKSIRNGKANLSDAYCYFTKGELFVKNMHISEYSHGSIFNHDPKRERKLLLHKNELIKLERKVKERGVTIIPLKLFVNERGLAKLEIALARGKKIYDKRESIKQKDLQRELERFNKF